MFSSLYSPFFTSGLLSHPITYPDSAEMPASVPRRGSLPNEGTSSTAAAKRSRESRRDEASAFYVALQPRRDEKEYRSFLSLDLAESQSMRSASLKHFRRPRSSKPIPPIPALPPVCPVSPLRTHFSRDSLRSIPSPKPAPSITLPALPSAQPSAAPAAPSPSSASTSSPPRLPDLPVLPALELSMSRQLLAPVRTPLSKPKLRRFSVATRATSSTVSTRVRRYNRSEALAALEGRRRRFAPITEVPGPWRHASPSAPKKNSVPNFMNMSDDDDDDDDVVVEDEDLEMADADADDEMADDDDLDLTAMVSDDPDPWGFNPILEPEDIVLPSSPGFLESPRKAPLPPARMTRLPFTPLQHYPYPHTFAVLTSSALSSSNLKSKSSSGSASQRQRRKRSPRHHHNASANSNPSSKQRPTKEWHGLTSFIDLHNDDDNSNSYSNSRLSTSWSWQSFIHVANVS